MAITWFSIQSGIVLGESGAEFAPYEDVVALGLERCMARLPRRIADSVGDVTVMCEVDTSRNQNPPIYANVSTLFGQINLQLELKMGRQVPSLVDVVETLAHEFWHWFANDIDFWRSEDGLEFSRLIGQANDYHDDGYPLTDKLMAMRWNTEGWSLQRKYDEQAADALAELVLGNQASWTETLGDITHDFMRNYIYDKTAGFEPPSRVGYWVTPTMAFIPVDRHLDMLEGTGLSVDDKVRDGWHAVRVFSDCVIIISLQREGSDTIESILTELKVRGHITDSFAIRWYPPEPPATKTAMPVHWETYDFIESDKVKSIIGQWIDECFAKLPYRIKQGLHGVWIAVFGSERNSANAVFGEYHVKDNFVKVFVPRDARSLKGFKDKFLFLVTHELAHAYQYLNRQEYLDDFVDEWNNTYLYGERHIPKEREVELEGAIKERWGEMASYRRTQEMFADALAELVSGISSPVALNRGTDIADDWMQSFIYSKFAQSAQEVHDTTEKDKGGTWDIPTGAPYKGKGFGVSRPSANESIPLEDWTVERAAEEIDERDDDPSAWLGTWLDDRGTDSSGDDVVYVDQTDIHDSVDVAKQKAKEHDQLAYYDFGAGKEVRVAQTDTSIFGTYPYELTQAVSRYKGQSWLCTPYDNEVLTKAIDTYGEPSSDTLYRGVVGVPLEVGDVYQTRHCDGFTYSKEVAERFGDTILIIEESVRVLHIDSIRASIGRFSAEGELLANLSGRVGRVEFKDGVRYCWLVDIREKRTARVARTVLDEIVETDGYASSRVVSVSASELPTRDQWNALCSQQYSASDIEFYSFIYKPDDRLYVLDEADPVCDHSALNDWANDKTVKIRVWLKGYGYRLELVSWFGYEGLNKIIAKKVCDDLERKGWITLADKVNYDGGQSTVADIMMGNAAFGKTARFADYDFNFCVWSDCYGAESVKKEALDQIGDEKTAIVIGIGDYNKTPSPEKLSEIRSAFDDSFGKEGWLSTPGNHETEYVDDKPDNLDWYFEHVGWGKVDGGSEEVAWTVVEDCLFVLVSSAFKEVSESALQEMSLCLAAHPEAKRRFVFTHTPVIDPIPPRENEEDHGMPSEQADEFMSICERFGVDAVFNSHQHGYETWTRRGVLYVITAGAGSPLDEQEEEYHYVRVNVGDVLRVERVPLFPSTPQKTQ